MRTSLVLSAAALLACAHAQPIANVTEGSLSGIARPDGTVAFLGVPYAEPPVASLRWAPPNPVRPWQGVRNATAFSAGCVQSCDLPPHTCPTVTSEDCLYINVFAPGAHFSTSSSSSSSSSTSSSTSFTSSSSSTSSSTSSSSSSSKGTDTFTAEYVRSRLAGTMGTKRAVADGGRPVLVFLPGGRFLQGAAMSTLYDGRDIVRENDVVVIVANYRLGALGFLRTKHDSTGIKGNFGIMDQAAVLEWARRNAAAFGGDPSRVMLFGQSAGGTSTAVHLTSPKSAGLFDAAIVESNPWTLQVRTEHHARAVGDRFETDIGCPSHLFEAGADIAACLRSKSDAEVLAAQKKAGSHVDPLYPVLVFYPWTPNVDGEWVLGQPLAQLSAGKFNRVPVVLGTVRDEGLLFIDQADGKPLPYEQYLELLVAVFHLHAHKVLELYPVPKEMRGDARPVLSTMTTDYIFLCPARNAARSLVRNGVPAWLYRFDHVASFNSKIWGPNYPYCAKDVVCHGSELPFLFDSAKYGGLNMTAAETNMSDLLAKMWANHAADPSTGPGGTAVSWPRYSAETDENLVIDVPMTTQSALRSQYCDAFDEIGYVF